jgi:hypothetical protein
MAAAGKSGISPWVWAALAALSLLALAVIFVLPQIVERYELPLVKRVEQPSAVAAPAQNAPQAPAVSPFEEAQLARQRREAQDALAALLNKQSELEMMGVEQWAADEFSQGLDAARRGDEFYRTGTFNEAASAYQEGDQRLGALLDQTDSVLARIMEEGQAALQASDATTALARFELAARIDPAREDVATGRERAETLDQVEALISDAGELQEKGDLVGAQALYDQAVALDPLHERATNLRQNNEQRIIDAEFTRIMSEGFALLDQGESEPAINAFQRALQVRPGSQQASEAIILTREQLTLARIEQYRQQAERHEQQEQWQQAIDNYAAALDLDANLVFAQEGKDYSERRLQLDTLLQANLDDPLRLSDAAAYQEALDVFRVASDLAQDLRAQAQGSLGPRLQSQIQQTEALLQQMTQPKEVRLISDNATQVTIYRFGELGTFSQTSVMLTPGRYVAVGTRPGYRDVREEFVVGIDDQPDAVVVQCSEQLVALDRR